MKYFWRLFCGITLLTEIIVASVGVMVIRTGWDRGIEREVDAADQSNDMLFFYLNETLEWSKNVSSLWGIASEADNAFEDLVHDSSTIQTSAGEVMFSVSDSNGSVIGGERLNEFDRELIIQLQKSNDDETQSSKKKGYEIKQVGDKYMIHYARPIFVENVRYYIENYRDVTDVFVQESENIRFLTLVMVLIIFVDAVVSYLVASQKELKEYALRQEMFVGNFEHELKTPLTSIIGYADMIRSKRMSEEQIVLLANQIVQEGKRLEVMSGKLMQLTVLKQQDFEFRKVSAKRFLTSVYDTVYPAMQETGIVFTANIQDGLLLIEPDLMKTVCMNILDNARKAIDGKDGRVVLTGRKIRKGYEITVQDNGRGIPKEELDKISEAFYMVDKARSRGQGGAGLGLAVCTSIMKVHKGKMFYESKLGVGTCVHVRLMEELQNERNLKRS